MHADCRVVGLGSSRAVIMNVSRYSLDFRARWRTHVAEEASDAASLVAAENTDAASPVTTVYWLPAKEVRSPKPLGARVIAAPPAEVMTVATFPPIAIKMVSYPFGMHECATTYR